MNRSHILLYPLLAAALFLSACAGQPDIQAPEQSGPQAPPEKAMPTKSEPSTGEQLARPEACDRYPDRNSFYGSDILFDFNSATLGPHEIDYIVTLADYLKCYSDTKFTLSGHTDARGPRDYNIRLGCRRAGAVRTELIERGIAAERINIMSYAADRPAVLGDNEEAWKSNRRVGLIEWVESGKSNCTEQ